MAWATLSAEFDLNGGTLRFQLSADGGAHWETVVPGQEHTFAYPGKRLRWRADLKPGRNFTASPVLYNLTIRYGEPPPPVVLDQQLWLPVIQK